jgi:hypothetical protein
VVEIAMLLAVGHRGLGKRGRSAHLKGWGPRNLRKKGATDRSLGAF